MKPISIFLVFSFAFVSAYADYIDSNYVIDDTQFNTDSFGGCKPSLTTTSGLLGEFNDTLCSGQLIFVENFDRLDKNRWKAEVTLGGGGNNEFQWYVDDNENRFVKNGKLYLRPSLTVDKIGAYNLEHGYIKLDGCTDHDPNACHKQAQPNRIINPIRSARLNTDGTFSFKYGRVEVIAKNPTGDWLWPAIWFLPTKWKYGGWPRSGEIDLMESRGNRKYDGGGGRQIGVEKVMSTLHFGPRWDQNGFRTSSYAKNNANGYNNGFHKYEVHWSPQGIRFHVDGSEIGFVPAGDGFWRRGGFHGDNIWKHGTKMAPFDEEFHFVLNLAIGGTNGFFPDNGNQNGKKPWTDNNPAEAATLFWRGRKQWLDGWKLKQNNGDSACLVIDSIKVWAL